MLAVVASPHRFTTALTSEASIVPGASYRRITPTACPGRELGAASQVRSCFVQLSQLVLQLRVAPPFPNCTGPIPSIHLSREYRSYRWESTTTYALRGLEILPDLTCVLLPPFAL